uniref:Retrovirus-related Pol polyprotein from transposon TNT 1-94 n=1 Tax=Tanacetum cinerariifolium TaxID=118510 RepID=A0A6L2MTJ1_TANCI|nr:retrovirus-related Pol polyprotein from transposon TNT 1-94 [Tanacetum cinerariifolium]
MIATPGEPDLHAPVPKSFHEQTDEELTENDLKRMDADDQSIQTILLDLLEDEKFTSTDEESIESYYHRFMQRMNDLKRNKHFPENISSNLKFLNNLQPEWKRHVTIVRQTKNLHEADFTQIYGFLKMNQDEVNELGAEHINDPTKAMNNALILFAKAFQLTAPTNNYQRTSSNPRNRQIAQPVMNMGQDRQTQNVGGNDGNQFGQYVRQVAHNQQGYNAWQNGGFQGAQNVVQNVGVQNGGNQNGLVVVSGIANQSGTSNVVAGRAEDTGNGNQARDAAYLQTQLLIAQKEEAGIQLQAEEFDFMAAAGDLDKIEEVNSNCILMANLQHASTSGTQHDKVHVYDTNSSAEVQLNDNCYDNEIFNMFTQEERYTNLLKPIPEPQLLPQNDNHVTSVAPSMVQSGGTVETSFAPNEETRAHQETVYRNLVDMVNRNMRATNAELKSELARYKNQEQRVEIKKSSISSLMDEKKRLKHDFKIQEDKFLDKEVDLEARIKDLENIMLKRDQTVQTMHMHNPKPDSFYHPNQKMALGYPNPSYLKKAQLKQQSLYNGVFVTQTTKSKEELFLSNVSNMVIVSNMVNVSKTISIPNEDLSDDTIPSVVRKFLNEVKSSLVTLQSKFVRDFKSLAKEADESLDKQKSLEIEIERLLKASVSHDIMSIVQNGFVDAPSDLRTELDRTNEKLELCIIKKEKEHAVLWNNWYTKCEECKYDKISYDKAYNDMQQKVERLQAQLRDLKGKSSDTPRASNTLYPLNQKLESKIVELEFQVVNYKRKISHLKTTYKNRFDSIKSNRAHAKLHDLIYKNAQLRSRGFKNTSEPMKNILGTSVTPRVNKSKLSVVTPLFKKLHASMSSHSVPQPIEFNVVKHRNVIAPGIFKINPSQTPRLDLVPNKQSSASIRTNSITNSQRHVTIKEHVSSDTVTASSIGLVHTARTRRPQPKGKTRNDMVPSASKSSEVKKNITNDKFEIVCDTCKQCLVTANHDTCLPSSMNALNSRANKLCANVPLSANQKRHRTQVVQICLWCVDSGCSKHMTGNIKLLINFVWKFLGTVRFGNDHIAAILGYGDLKWGNITITRDSGFELTGFLDADYAGCKVTFKSTSGEAQFLGEKLVSWSSKKQDCTSLSTAKSEYVSLSACCAQVLWMRTQLTDYGYHFDKIPIYCDSKPAIAISCNPVQHPRMKHIAVRYHFIKEHLEKGTIELYYVRTDYQLADIFTIALPVDRFNYLVCRLGICSLCPQELDRLAKLQ